jgi:hypothetical protein
MEGEKGRRRGKNPPNKMKRKRLSFGFMKLEEPYLSMDTLPNLLFPMFQKLSTVHTNAQPIFIPVMYNIIYTISRDLSAAVIYCFNSDLRERQPDTQHTHN